MFTWQMADVVSAMGYRFPFSNFSWSDHNSRTGRMCRCCHKQQRISLDPAHVSWCSSAAAVLCIDAIWFARRSRPHAAIQRAHPADKKTICISKTHSKL